MGVPDGWTEVGSRIALHDAHLQLARDPGGVVHAILSRRGTDLGSGPAHVGELLWDPGVDGIAPLAMHDSEDGAYAYRIGDGVLLAQADTEGWGADAAVDLLLALGRVLDAATHLGHAGTAEHGAIDPWRIVLHSHGAVSVLGYGVRLPSSTEDVAHGAGVRFLAPERWRGAPASLAGDVYAVGLCAAEVLLGRPLLDGSGSGPPPAFAQGVVAERLRGEELGGPHVRQLILDCLSTDPGDRPGSGAELVRRVRSLGEEDLPIEPTEEAPEGERRGCGLHLLWSGPWALVRGAFRLIAREWSAPYQGLVVAPAERRRRSGLQAAASVAVEEAEACQRLVEDAEEMLRSLSPVLRSSSAADPARMRDEAIASVQQAKAELAPLLALAEEARGLKAKSEIEVVAERIRQAASAIEDRVDAALHTLQEAEVLAEESSGVVARAIREAAQASEVVEQLEGLARKAAAAGRERAEDLTGDNEIKTKLAALDVALEGYASDRAEAALARDRARQVDDPDTAHLLITSIQPVVERARARRRHLDLILKGLSDGVEALESTSQALEDARQTVSSAIVAVSSDLERTQGASDRVERAVLQHRASGEEVAAAQDELKASVDTIEDALVGLRELSETVRAVSDPAEGRRLARQAQQHREAAEEAVERAADAEVAGIAAAQKHDRDRKAQVRRSLADARQLAEQSLQQARRSLERLDAVVTSARDEVSGLDAAPARTKLTLAMEQATAVQGRLAELELLGTEVATEDAAAAAEAKAEQLQALATRVGTDAEQAQQVVLTALDSARSAAQDAASLERVRNELQEHVPQVDAAIERARSQMERLQELIDDLPDAEQSVEAAAEQLRVATVAADEVRSLGRSGEGATDLRAAQDLVRAARLAQRRATRAADALTALVNDALSAVERARQEAAARALAEARQRAADSAQEAMAAAKKAEAWLEAGRREVVDAGVVSEPPAGLGALSKEVQQVYDHAADAQAASAEAAEAETAEAIEAAVERTEQAARRAAHVSSSARRTLHRLRSVLAELQESMAVVSDLVRQAREHQTAATQLADQVEATLAELEVWARHADPQAVSGAVSAVRDACADARLAAEQTEQAASQVARAASEADARTWIEQAERHRQEAVAAAGRVVAGERDARDALERAQRQAPVRDSQRSGAKGGLRVGRALRARLQGDRVPGQVDMTASLYAPRGSEEQP
ncbi:MAG: hypothetical protein KTR31_17585 [Myxococcales bacterium]|nr:hypothetical protein [Myxococcales bacterium]